MLTKAILTGGVLSVLAGSIVYFGTEGADALERDAHEDVRVEETELAGGVESVDVVEVEVKDPSEDQPKTKWLDQYLKKSSDKAKTKPAKKVTTVTETEVVTESEEPRESIVEKKVRIKTKLRNDGSDSAKGTYIVSKDARVETLNVDGLDLDEDIDVERLKEQLGLTDEHNVEVRVIKKKVSESPSRFSFDAKETPSVDYGAVLGEAKKLMVTDMRNQAVLEIVDYAIDNGDMMQAADLVEELSTPELRDTARARIGTGLARSGEADAAFAVLDELEIDELSAPIRLEIITALMATKQERKSFVSQ